jgi:hypothetical protein
VTSNDFIAERLSVLADQEFDSVKTWIGTLEFPQHVLLLIEACRVMDFQHVLQAFSKKPEHKLPVPDFDIMIRGWNPALGLLPPHAGGSHGVPLAESTPESRNQTMAFLHQLGRFSVLKQSAGMVRHGMLEGELVNGCIVLRLGSRLSTDFFLDRLDRNKLNELRDKVSGFNPLETLEAESKVGDLDARMEALVFPWKTAAGTMIGYQAEPDIDRYFLAHVTQHTLDWRDEAGIHPHARIGDVSGVDLAALGSLLTSLHVKHIRFVDAGKRKVPEANYPMSLTMWTSRSELVDSIVAFTGMGRDNVDAAVDLFTVSRAHYDYFQLELTPFIPMLIEISEGHLLRPVSSIFRNPFQGIRMFQEHRSSRAEAFIRKPRENWMISDLSRLFVGNRYEVIDRPTRLKRGGNTVTDIDSAVLDRTTGVVALFQLKWQDFSTEDIRKRRSKAKNFVDQVDEWAQTVSGWIGEFGTDALRRSLRLGSKGHISDVKMFAIGRSSSRFQSYGYVPKCRELAVCAWAQLVRLRYEVGPAANVLQSLHDKIQSESSYPIDRKPMPHKIIAAGQELLFEDLWNDYDEENEQ